MARQALVSLIAAGVNATPAAEKAAKLAAAKAAKAAKAAAEKAAKIAAAEKAAADTLAAEKAAAAAEKAAKLKAAAAPVGVKFAVRDSFRPAAGSMLFAYTRAWLEVSGLNAGGSISRSHAVTLAGGTAIAYHTLETGRFIDKSGSISLAENAAAFFAARGGDQKNIDIFAEVLRKGIPDGTLVKNQAGIVELK